MLRKLCIFAAVAAALFIAPAALPVTAMAIRVMAITGHGYKHGHVKNDWNDRINWNAPFRGRWWGYGEGASGGGHQAATSGFATNHPIQDGGASASVGALHVLLDGAAHSYPKRLPVYYASGGSMTASGIPFPGPFLF